MKHSAKPSRDMKLPSLVNSNWFVAALLAVVTYLVLSSVLLLHRTSFFVNLDNVDQFYTWYQKLAISWHHGYLPVWDANVFSGQSFAGELQPGVFYPLNWLWVALFGSVRGISEMSLNYLVAVHFWLAALGAYLLIKELGARRWAAFLAGVTFAFSGVVAFRSISQTVIFFGLALLPYSLYFLVRYHNEARRRWLILSGLALGMLLLVGHVEPFYHALLALLIFETVYIYRSCAKLEDLWQLVWSGIKKFVVIGCFAVLIAAPQLWVSASYLGNSYRVQAGGYAGPGQKISYADFAKAFNLDTHEFINLVDPVTYQIRDGNNIFIGLAPLVVLIVGWWAASKRLRATELWRRQGSFVALLLVFSAVAMLGYVTWFAVLLYKLPLVYQIRQLGRYSILFDLGLVIMLAAALQAVRSARFTGTQRRNILLAGLFLLVNAVYLFALRHHIFSLHMALQTGLAALTLIALALLNGSKARQLTLTSLILLTAAVNTLWFLPKIQADTETTKNYSVPSSLINLLERTNGQYRVEIDDSALPVNTGNVFPLQTVWGYGATVYAPYYRIWHTGSVNQEFLKDILGVKYVVGRGYPSGSRIVYADKVQQVYVMDRSSALSKIFTTTSPGSLERQDYHSLPVITDHYDDRYQKFTVSVPRTEPVIISEIQYPGWELQVDGKATAWHAYDIAGDPLLRTFTLPAGRHSVEFSYHPFLR